MNTTPIIGSRQARPSHWRSRTATVGAVCRRAALALTLCSTVVNPLSALPLVNNNAGTFFDDYGDNAGMVLRNQVTIATAGTVSLVPSQTSGSYTTVNIEPTSFDRWEELDLRGTYSAVGHLTVEVLDLNNNVRLGPLPVTGVPINLNVPSLNTPLIPGLKVRVSFSQPGSSGPTVDSLQMKWRSVSKLFLGQVGPIEVQSGDRINYGLHYSVSHVGTEGVVIFAPLPTHLAGSVVYPREYGQADDPTFVSATKGGLYTVEGLTLNDVPVPPNSVYWKLDHQAEGTADYLDFTLVTMNGTLNGTIVTNRAYARGANVAPVESPRVVTTIRSAPWPLIDLQESTGIFEIGDELQTRPGTVNRFSITARNNFQARGAETLYGSEIYADVSDLVNRINDRDDAGLADDFFSISPADGLFDPAYDPPGPIGPIPAIVWDPRKLAPGAQFDATFSVELSSNQPTTHYTNSACLISDQTISPTCDQIVVNLMLNGRPSRPPSVRFVKSSSAPTVFHRGNRVQVVPYGGNLAFTILLLNKNAVKLNDILIVDQVPPNTRFNSAWIDNPKLILSGATIFYSTSPNFPDLNSPPPVTDLQMPVDLDEPGNTYWQPSAPANPNDVTWLAYYIPQLDSVYLPDELPRAWPPDDSIPSAFVHYDVTVITPPDPCDDTNVLNRALGMVYKFTDLSGDKNVIPDGALTFSTETRLVATGYKGALAASSAIAPDPVDIPASPIYSLTVRNSSGPSSDTLVGVQAVVRLSQVPVNGVLRYPSVQPLSPGSDTSVPGQVTVDLGLMGVGASRVITLQLGFPAGIPTETECIVSATVTGEDDQCGPSIVTTSARCTVRSSPRLSVSKTAPAHLIPSGATYEYFLNFINLGTGPSTRTWVVDQVPASTVFVQATGNPDITAVWFSGHENLPPHTLTPSTPITASLIQDRFIRGTPQANDVWASDLGDQTRWVAWEVSNPAFNPPQVPINVLQTLGLTVRNDDNGPASGTAGSEQGKRIYNSGGIFSDVLPQAIGNQIITTIDDHPSIVLGKSGPLSVEAGVPFDWVLTYRNDTLITPDDLVRITDTLPRGINLVGTTVRHTWNAQAVANGAPAGIQIVSPGIEQVGGSTVLTLNIAGPTGLRGEGIPLAGREGGTLTLRVQADSATPSGTKFRNDGCATATTAADTFKDCADHEVIVFRPNLELRKSVSPSSVLAGGILTYTLELENHGPIAARNVVLRDILPTGISYVGALSVTPGYSLDPPAITGQTLLWSVTNNNALTRSGFPAGELPSTPETVRIQFNVQVANNTAGCTSFTNSAHVSTISFQEGSYPNDAVAIASVPAPDPAVVMSSSQALVRPGNHATWRLTWANESLQPAQGVYLVDTLPNNVTFTDVSVQGVTIYYNAAPANPVPAFDPLDPPATGWSAVRPNVVNHLAFYIGTLAGNAGPFTALVSVDLIDPVTHFLPDPGTSFTNAVVISQMAPPACDISSNNTATAVVRTPALDVALTKTGSIQGSIPGIAPGQPITYTLVFENSGTVDAYGVKIIDTLPDALFTIEPLDNLAVVRLFDEAGIRVRPVDPTGQPIEVDVPVTRVVLNGGVTWFLGTTGPGTLNYTNIGLPPGSRGSFQLYVMVTNSVADSVEVCNPATVFADVGDEDVLGNNTARSCVTVRRADVVVNKIGLSSTGNSEFVEAGEEITYTIKYNNLADIPAHDVVINEIVPSRTRLVSVEPPPGSTVTYSPDQANATSFSVKFGRLPGPANLVGNPQVSAQAGTNAPPSLSITPAANLTDAIITWPSSAQGYVLESTDILNLPIQWQRVQIPVTQFPEGRQGVIVAMNKFSSFYRLRFVGGCFPGTLHLLPTTKPQGFVSWNMLYVDHTIPDGGTIFYTVGRVVGTEYEFDLGSSYTSVAIGPDGLNLSGIDPAYTDLVLQAEITAPPTSNSSCVNAFQMTYYSTQSPFFTFKVRVDPERCGDPPPIRNEVTITTSTPEKNEDNNDANYTMVVRRTDLEVRSAVSATAILEGETLTHTTEWRVNGPQSATDTYLQVALPDVDGVGGADVILDTVLPVAGVNVYFNRAPTLSVPAFNPDDPTANDWAEWTGDGSDVNHLVFLLGTRMSDGVWRTLLYTTKVKVGTAGQNLCFTVTGLTDRLDKPCENNSASSCTFVGALANVFVKQIDPGCVHPGDLVTFRITYGNDGNAPATNVVVTDALPPELTFIRADPIPTGPGPSWNNLGSTPGTLAVGETGTITVTAQLANDCALIRQTLINLATISTRSEQVDVADDRATALIGCITPNLAGLSGYVYQDLNGDCLREGAERGISGVTITLTGSAPCGAPPTVTHTTVTDENGGYSFVGLYPGEYTLTEIQPPDWDSAGDATGTLGGINDHPLDNVLGTITLAGGRNGLEYNFCETPFIVPSCAQISNEVLLANGPGRFTWSFDFKNLSTLPVKYLFLVPDPPLENCFGFTPPNLSLSNPIPPGQTARLNVTLNTTNCGPEICFLVAPHDPTFVECCSFQHCLTLPGFLQPAAALPVLSASREGGQFILTLPTKAGVTCHIEYTDSLALPHWHGLKTLTGDGTVMTVSAPLTNAPQRFYRVRTE